MPPQLYMILLGCRPKGRHTEQHDIFFGIGSCLADLKPAMQQFWPGVKLHIDAWRVVTNVDGYSISVVPKTSKEPSPGNLYFLNLGGYRANEFEEFHYKMLSVANDKSAAVKLALKSAFYKHNSMPANAKAHIDDRYGVDVDEIFAIRDILPEPDKKAYRILISKQPDIELNLDELHLGYTKWSGIK